MTVTMIDDATVAAFERDGAVAVRGLLDDHWITTLRDNIDALLEQAYDPRARMGGTRAERSKNVMSDGMWADNDGFRHFLFESPIGETAAYVHDPLPRRRRALAGEAIALPPVDGRVRLQGR